MKVLKNIILIIMISLIIVCLAGCGKKEEKKAKHEKNPIVTMQVSYTTANNEKKEGTIKLELYPNEAPQTVDNFVNLINNGFYDGLKFHRINDFMIQGGDPNGDGTGVAKLSDLDKSIEPNSEADYQYSIKGEFSANDYENNVEWTAGTLAMARSDYSNFGMVEEGYNSACSQFFIMNTDDEKTNEYLKDLYAAFGKVIEGYDVVQEISNIKLLEADNGEVSKPEVAPVILKMTVDTFGESYDKPKTINADEVLQKVEQAYMQLLQQYYGNMSGTEE